jgi:hypothetical protein
MRTETDQDRGRPSVGAKNKSRKHIKRYSSGTRRAVSAATVDHAEISISAEQLMEKVRFDVMSIIESCESSDNDNAYDIGHRDGVAEVRVVMNSYFRNLRTEIEKNPEYPSD